MAPSHHLESPPSDEEDAPESLSLLQTKQQVQQQDQKLRDAHAAEKERKRAHNRERDQRLKARAEESKRQRKEAAGGGQDDVESRMERAMREARDELDGGAEEGSMDLDGDEEDDSEDGEGSDHAEADDDNDDDDDEMGSDTDDEAQFPEPPHKKTKTNPNHLPDHLFTAAFATATNSSSKQTAAAGAKKRQPRKRTRPGHTPKDVIVGARTIRALPSAGTPPAPATLPPTRIKKFIERSLALKGGGRARGWERRAANIGVMRRDGPAAGFVRNR